jgi:hypothetical protein
MAENDCLKNLRKEAEGFYFSPRIEGKKIRISPAGAHRIILEGQRTYLFGPYPSIVPSVTSRQMQKIAEREARKVPAHPDNHDGDKCRLCGGSLAKSPVDYMGEVEVAGRKYARYCPECEHRPPSYGGKISGEQYERETDIPEYLYLQLLAQEAAGKEEQGKPQGFLEKHGIHLRLGN